MMRKITVITADVVKSRENLDYLNELEDKLKTFKEPMIICPFSMSRGDEIQGVVEGWLKAPHIIRNLRNLCRPLKLRVGIGIGITKDSEIKTNSWQMTGQAFFLARMALEEVEKSGDSLTIVKTGISEFDEFINSIWLLIDTIQDKWTEKQWEAVQAYEKSGTYREASKILKISIQGVMKRCKAAQWSRLKKAEDTLGKIQTYLEKYHLFELFKGDKL